MKNRTYKVFLLKTVVFIGILILVVLLKSPNACSYTIQRANWDGGGYSGEGMLWFKDSSGAECLWGYPCYFPDPGNPIRGKLPSGSWVDSEFSWSTWWNKVTLADGTILTSFYLQEVGSAAYELMEPLSTSYLRLDQILYGGFDIFYTPDYGDSIGHDPNISVTQVITLFGDDGIIWDVATPFDVGLRGWLPGGPPTYLYSFDATIRTIIDYDDLTAQSGSNAIQVLYNVTILEPVPEPSTMLLLGFGLIGLAGYGRKKFFKK